MKKNNVNKEIILNEMYYAADFCQGLEKIHALGIIANLLKDDETLNCIAGEAIGNQVKYETPQTTMLTYNEEALVAFGNFILTDRFNKLFGVNPEFVTSILTLNPTFFEMNDSDIKNFENK